jgi:hypothetical protein
MIYLTTLKNKRVNKMKKDVNNFYFFPSIEEDVLKKYIPIIQHFNDTGHFNVVFDNGHLETFKYYMDTNYRIIEFETYSTDEIIKSKNWWDDFNSEDEIRNAWIKRIGEQQFYFYWLEDIIKESIPTLQMV